MFFRKKKEDKVLQNLIIYLKENNIDNYNIKIKKINNHKYEVVKQHTNTMNKDKDFWNVGYEESLIIFI